MVGRFSAPRQQKRELELIQGLRRRSTKKHFKVTNARMVSSLLQAMCWAGASKIWISSTRKSNFQKILSHKMSEIEKDFHRCGQACLKDSKCCSYEFSPTYKQCNLNKECLPTTKKFQDFLFCKKIPSSAGMNR